MVTKCWPTFRVRCAKISSALVSATKSTFRCPPTIWAKPASPSDTAKEGRVPREHSPPHSTRATRHSFLDHRPQHNIAILDAGVVPLQINRTGPAHIRPQRAAGASFNRLIVDDFFSIEDNRRMSLNECDV